MFPSPHKSNSDSWKIYFTEAIQRKFLSVSHNKRPTNIFLHKVGLNWAGMTRCTFDLQTLPGNLKTKLECLPTRVALKKDERTNAGLTALSEHEHQSHTTNTTGLFHTSNTAAATGAAKITENASLTWTRLHGMRRAPIQINRQRRPLTCTGLNT